MGHINLSIKRDNEIKPYNIVSAEYINEAWIAETFEDNTTKIIKQFKCGKFKNCFPELAACMVHLGEVVELSSDDIEQRNVNRLRNILNHKYFDIPQTIFSEWKWLNALAIPIMHYRLLSC